MSEKAIRFGVTDGAGKRAATWKLWTPPNKADIYLTCRELREALKASLHQSGQWHYAYSQKTFEEQVKDVILSKEDSFIK